MMGDIKSEMERDEVYEALRDAGWNYYGGDPAGFIRKLATERDRYRDTLLSRHGGEPLALLDELDEARRDVEYWRGLACDIAKERDALRANIERLTIDAVRTYPFTLTPEQVTKSYAAGQPCSSHDEDWHRSQ